MSNRLDKKLKNNYTHQALKLLVKYNEPNIDDIYENVCLHGGNCPVGHCKHPNGFTYGRECGHIISIQQMIERILETINRY